MVTVAFCVLVSPTKMSIELGMMRTLHDAGAPVTLSASAPLNPVGFTSTGKLTEVPSVVAVGGWGMEIEKTVVGPVLSLLHAASTTHASAIHAGATDQRGRWTRGGSRSVIEQLCVGGRVIR